MSARDGGAARRSRRRQRGREAFGRGHWAEALASLSLRLKGYRILARRLRTPVGEIDILARRGACLVFVEVKARPSLQDALGAVTGPAQARLIRAAQHVRASRTAWAAAPARFDVIAVVPWRWPIHRRNVIEQA